MTLRQDYFDGLTGLQNQLLDAFTNGGTFVTTNLATLSSGLQTAASQGKTTFVITIQTTFKPTALRLNGLLLAAYLDGISDALNAQNIFAFECEPTLNTSDISTTSIDFNFTFQTT